jgi:CxxC motif-containing protein
MGCHLKVNVEENKVTGNSCKRGLDYGLSEVTNPVRVITTTVKVKDGDHNLIPVKTKGEIPKGLIFDCMEELKKVEVTAPIKIGDIVIANILNTGIDIVSCRECEIFPKAK